MNIDRKILNNIQEKLDTTFDVETLDETEIEGILEELVNTINSLEEKIKHLEQDIEDNYRPISYAEQIGYNERDFI